MPGFTTRPQLRGDFGMVASTHWLASATGMSVLERGGNAFDAAVAAGFTLQVAGGWYHFAPIFTLGRYTERDGRTVLPLAVQVHHAVADGFHTARLLGELQDLASDPSWIS